MSQQAERGVEVVEEYEGVRLYTDPEVEELGDMFRPETYRSRFGSNYGDNGIEQALFPFALIGKNSGRYFGFDDEGLMRTRSLMLGFSHPYSFAGVPLERYARIAEYEGKRVLFPTQEILESFGVIRKPEIRA